MSLQQIQVSVGGLRSGTGYLVPQGFHRFDAQDEKLAMLGAPQSRFSGMICRLEFRTSLETGGRPGRLRPTFDVQSRGTPLPCQLMTVSGVWTIVTERHSLQTSERSAHNRASNEASFGRFLRSAAEINPAAARCFLVAAGDRDPDRDGRAITAMSIEGASGGDGNFDHLKQSEFPVCTGARVTLALTVSYPGSER